MKNIKKVVSLVAALALCLSILVGCTADELLLFNALCKQTDINSYESKTELTFKLTSEGLNNSDKATFEQIASVFNGMEIAVNQKVSGNKEKTLAKSQSDVSVSINGISADVSAWTEVDLTGDTPKINCIAKIPKSLLEFLPVSSGSDMSNKEYLALDLVEILNSGSSQKNGVFSKEYLEFSKDLTPKLISFIKEYAKEFNPGFSIVTSKGTQTIDNQTLTLYNLKLDDANFKNLLAYSVTNFVKNERAMDFVKNLVLDYIQASNLSYREKLTAQGEVNKYFDEFKTNLPEFLKDWDNVMAVLKDVQILGDKGINIEFGVNKDGFIVSQKGTIEIVINSKDINGAIEKYKALTEEDYIAEEVKDEGTITFEIDYNTTTTKINQNVVVELPKVTSENSINFEDLINIILDSYSYSNSGPGGKYEPDTTPPDAPTVNKVTKTSKSVSGKAEAFSTITIKKGNTVIGEGMADEEGAFSITIDPLKTKTTLTVTATDLFDNESAATTVEVN